MKRNQVNELLEEETKRRHSIFYSFCVVFVIFGFFAFSVYLYLEKNKGFFVTYKEDSDIDYKVYLKQNDFFEENYLDDNNRYIASLIDYINATFKYNILMEDKDVDFKYNYRIESNVEVIETSIHKKYRIIK